MSSELSTLESKLNYLIIARNNLVKERKKLEEADYDITKSLTLLDYRLESTLNRIDDINKQIKDLKNEMMK